MDGEEVSFASLKGRKKSNLRKKAGPVAGVPEDAPAESAEPQEAQEETADTILKLRKSKQSRMLEKEKKKKEKERESGGKAQEAAVASGGEVEDEYSPARLQQLKQQSHRDFVLKPLDHSAADSDVISALGLAEGKAADEAPSNTMEVDEDGFAIPSAAEIKNIKRQRQRMQGREDFIPLADPNVPEQKDDDDDPDSRLVRDSAMDDDDAEMMEALGNKFDGRYHFGDPGKGERRPDDEEAIAQEADDEDQRWLLEQLKRSGVKKTSSQFEEAKADKRRALPPPAAKVIPLNYPGLDELVKKLGEEMQDLQTLAAKHRYKLNKVRDSIQETKQHIQTISDEQAALNVK